MISDNPYSSLFQQVKLTTDFERLVSQTNEEELEKLIKDSEDINVWRGASANPHLLSSRIDCMLVRLENIFNARKAKELKRETTYVYRKNNLVYATQRDLMNIMAELGAHPNLSTERVTEMLSHGLWYNEYQLNGGNSIVVNPKLSSEQCIRFFDKFISPALGYISLDGEWWEHYVSAALLWLKTIPLEIWNKWVELFWFYFSSHRSKWKMTTIMLKSPHFNQQSCDLAMTWVESLNQVSAYNFSTMVDLLDSVHNDAARASKIRQRMFDRTSNAIFVKKDAAEIFVF